MSASTRQLITAREWLAQCFHLRGLYRLAPAPAGAIALPYAIHHHERKARARARRRSRLGGWHRG